MINLRPSELVIVHATSACRQKHISKNISAAQAISNTNAGAQN